VDNTRIGVFVFNGAEELDFIGPWEVLASWARNHPDDGIEIFTVAQSQGPITCAKGLRVLADHTWETSPQIDVLIYPGGKGTRAQIGDRTIGDWLDKTAAQAQIMASVCTGALVFADNGLLDNMAATTHWESLDHLAELGEGIEVRPQDRFVDNGSVITAAGVSAGIDMALHLVARLASVERARQVRRYIQYDPQPPV